MLTAPTLPLPEWIQIARLSISKEEYIECAVSVALELTNRLCLVVGTARNNDRFNPPLSVLNSSLSSWNEFTSNDFEFLTAAASEKKQRDGLSSLSLPVQIEDIVPENVVVSIAENDVKSRAGYFTATEVNVISATSKPDDISEIPQLSQKHVCLALGKILFELFSQGDSLLMIDMHSIAESEVDSFDELLGCIGLINVDESLAPAKKKSVLSTHTSAGSSTSATKAKAFLQERGLPSSVCRLVSDLLDTEEGKENQFVFHTALVLLEDAQTDLMMMRAHPQRFFYDHTCQTAAWESTSLFDQTNCELYGREEELVILMDAAARVSLHMPSPCGANKMNRGKNSRVLQMNNFLCEAVFLSGHSGAGKSSIIKKLVSFCNANDWFVLICKFDRQIAPLSILLQSLDSFFGFFVHNERDVSVQDSFARISLSMMSSIDDECFSQLCQLLPNLRKVFPMATDYSQQNKMQNGTSGDFLENLKDGVGSGSNRLNHLFQLMFKAICSGGYPLVIVLDDLQWSDAFTMSIIGDLIQSNSYTSAFSAEEESPHGGLLLLGSFRDNEVEEDGFLMNQIKFLESSSGNLNVSRVFIGELPEHEINKMLSFKLCLPLRHTRELAEIVHQKTRGNPLYVVEFLRSIIKENVLSFSVKSRQFTWDETCINMQMMSVGVVELLTRKLMQLPHDVVEALKVASCFGQINISMIELLDLGWFVPNLLQALEFAVQERILEKAGTLFAFSHDMLRESTYNLIPVDERKPLHKKIGKSFVQDPGIAGNAELCTLAVDQMNICKDDILDPAERALFARLNLAAGKHCVAALSYEQARGYFEAGISLLHANPWSKQYSLCLELYEMSVSVSYMHGKVETVLNRLHIILSNASFEDALNSRALKAKVLASQLQYAEAVSGVLGVLSYFGEEFLQDASLVHVSSEINATLPMLKDITKEKILSLKPMTDKLKLNAMKFMDLLIALSFYAAPMLVPLVTCRMMKLSIELGYCNDTIPALAYMSNALLHYSDDIQLAGLFGRIAESLIHGNPQEHSLRARLTQMHCSVKYFVEPFQTIPAMAQNGYNSATIAGDVDNAMLSLFVYSTSHLFVIPDLVGLHKKMINFLHQMAKNKKIAVLISTMAYFNTVTALMGKEESCGVDPSIGLKTPKEIFQVAEHTQNHFLMHHVIVNQMYVHCYFREYLHVANLAEKYGMKTQARRILDFYIIFYQGIAALCLARDTKQDKWRKIGEKSVNAMTQLVEHSTWNFENMLHLLQAELNYVNGHILMAELSYQAAIMSAHEHRFYHEEALSCEQYGIFLIENKKVGKGLEQLQAAKVKYEKWGAAKKADAVLDFMDLVGLTLQVWRA